MEGIKKLIILLLISLLNYSCSHSGGEVLLKHTFENNSWERFKPIRFDIDVSHPEDDYSINLFVSFTEDFNSEDFIISYRIASPSGEIRSGEKMLKVKSIYGNFTKQKNVKNPEYNISLVPYITFHKKGSCIVEIENLIPKFESQGIRSLSIELKKRG